MNEFELFTMIYFALDAYYEGKTDDGKIVSFLSDMNPFLWDDIGSADPAVYSNFVEFLKGKRVSKKNSLKLAREYLRTIDYVDITSALDEMTEERWQAVCDDYLSSPHKGSK